jgi:RNA polymerase sigma factor FliA
LSIAITCSAGLPPSVEVDDLFSYGTFGLIEALERYELDRNVKFEAYAVGRIRGAMLDALRSLDWVPRSVRAKARQIDKAMTKLQSTLRRDPTEEELAAELDCSTQEVRKRLDVTAGMSVLALEDLLTVSGDDGSRMSVLDSLPDPQVPDPAEVMETDAVRGALRQAIEGLGERDRKVVLLYYLEGFTLARIGEVLGVTESRVSQIHSEAVVAMRVRMNELLAG